MESPSPQGNEERKGDVVTLTDIDVDRCMSPSGGFKGEVIRMLGENASVMGWRKRLRGMQVTRETYEQARAVAALPKLKHVPYGEAKGQLGLF